MICENCNKNKATVHFVRILNGKKEHLFLCEKCAGEMGDLAFDNKESNISDLDFHKILNGLVDYLNNEEYKAIDPIEIDTCSVCGTKYKEFQETEIIGCKNCVEVFDKEARDIIKKLHGSLEYKGRVPKKRREEIFTKKNISALKLELKAAIKREDYENAARVRDEIKKQEGLMKGSAEHE